MQINRVTSFTVENFEVVYGTLSKEEKNFNLDALAIRIEHFARIKWWEKNYKDPFFIINFDANDQPLPYFMEEESYKKDLSWKDKSIHYFKMASGAYCQQVIECANRCLSQIKKNRNFFWSEPLDSAEPFQDLSQRCKKLQIMLDEELFWVNAVKVSRQTAQSKGGALKKWMPKFVLNKLQTPIGHLESNNLGMLTPKDFIARKDFCLTSFMKVYNENEIEFSIKGVLPHFNPGGNCNLLRFETTYFSNPLNEKVAAVFDIQKNRTENHHYLLIHNIDVYGQWQTSDAFLFQKLFQLAMEVFEKEEEPLLQVNSYNTKTACLLFSAGMTTLNPDQDADYKNRLAQASEGTFFSGENENKSTTFFIYKKRDHRNIIRFYTDPHGTQEAHVCFNRQYPLSWSSYLEGRRILTHKRVLFPSTQFHKLNHLTF